MLSEQVTNFLEKDPPNLLGKAVLKGLETPGVQLPVFMTGVVVVFGAILADGAIEAASKRIDRAKIIFDDKIHKNR